MSEEANYLVELAQSMKPRSTLHYILYGSFFTILALDLLYFPATSDIRYFILGLLWFFITATYRLKSTHTILVVLGLIILLFFFYLFDRNSQITERIATWIYILLFFGLIQQIVEIRKQSS